MAQSVEFFVVKVATGDVVRRGMCPSDLVAMQALPGEEAVVGPCEFDEAYYEGGQLHEAAEFTGSFDVTQVVAGSVATLSPLPEGSWVEADNVLTQDIMTGSYSFSSQLVGTHNVRVGASRHKVKTLQVEVTPNHTLETAKAEKSLEINEARLAATYTSFTHAGKTISCDRLSRSDIDGTNGHVTLFGAFPSGWPGGWKAVDNTYVPILTVEQWKDFYASLTSQGTANFNHAQQLKAQLAAATTLAEVEAITW